MRIFVIFAIMSARVSSLFEDKVGAFRQINLSLCILLFTFEVYIFSYNIDFFFIECAYRSHICYIAFNLY